MTYLWLIVGGVCGALCRYHAARLIQARTARNFPLGTWVINLSGSFMLGLLLGILQRYPWLPRGVLGPLFGTGFCGAYTTFSSFAFETIQLWRQGQARDALVNALGQPLFGGVCAWLGLWIGLSMG